MQSLQRYPTLKSALFPSKVDSAMIDPGKFDIYSNGLLFMFIVAQFCVPNTRDIYTSKKDVSLKELLEDAAPFYLDYLFGAKAEKESTFPNIPVWYAANLNSFIYN